MPGPTAHKRVCVCVCVCVCVYPVHMSVARLRRQQAKKEHQQNLEKASLGNFNALETSKSSQQQQYIPSRFLHFHTFTTKQ